MQLGRIGCGVFGLSTGIRLLEHGFEVQILAREQSPNTTSDVAAAFWYPFRAEPREKVLSWARISYSSLVLLRIYQRLEFHAFL